MGKKKLDIITPVISSWSPGKPALSVRGSCPGAGVPGIKDAWRSPGGLAVTQAAIRSWLSKLGSSSGLLFFFIPTSKIPPLTFTLLVLHSLWWTLLIHFLPLLNHLHFVRTSSDQRSINNCQHCAWPQMPRLLTLPPLLFSPCLPPSLSLTHIHTHTHPGSLTREYPTIWHRQFRT